MFGNVSKDVPDHGLENHPDKKKKRRDFWWNSVGFVFLTCYHWWWLAPVNLFTGVNVATMSVPPDSLEMFGKYYRPVWGVICGLLQVGRRFLFLFFVFFVFVM